MSGSVRGVLLLLLAGPLGKRGPEVAYRFEWFGK